MGIKIGVSILAGIVLSSGIVSTANQSVFGVGNGETPRGDEKGTGEVLEDVKEIANMASIRNSIFEFLETRKKDLEIFGTTLKMSLEELKSILGKSDADRLSKFFKSENLLDVVVEAVDLEEPSFVLNVGSGEHFFKCNSVFKDTDSLISFVNKIFCSSSEQNSFSGVLELQKDERSGEVFIARKNRNGDVLKKCNVNNGDLSGELIISYNKEERRGFFEKLFFKRTNLHMDKNEEYENMFNLFHNIFDYMKELDFCGANVGEINKVSGPTFMLSKRELKNIYLNHWNGDRLEELGINLDESKDDDELISASIAFSPVAIYSKEDIYLPLALSKNGKTAFIKTKYAGNTDINSLIDLFNYIFEETTKQKNLKYQYLLKKYDDGENICLIRYALGENGVFSEENQITGVVQNMQKNELRKELKDFVKERNKAGDVQNFIKEIPLWKKVFSPEWWPQWLRELFC